MDYYQWKSVEFPTGDRRMSAIVKPGVRPPDVAERLLAEHVATQGASDVLDMNCGTGVVGASIALREPAVRLTLVDRNIVHVKSAKKTIEANAVTRAAVYFSQGSAALPADFACDVVTIRLPKGRLPILQLLAGARAVLRPNGRCYLAGGNDEGIKSATTRMAEFFGNAQTLAYKGGTRVAVAIKRDEPPSVATELAGAIPSHDAFDEFTINVRARRLSVWSRPGVFSHGRLDDGSQLLIDRLEIFPAQRVLDLGCGSGVIGAAAAILATRGNVHLLDMDYEAVRSAEKTVRGNALGNCTVLASDCGEQVRTQKFDVVLTNPPFHLAHRADLEVVHQFIKDAASLLDARGRFFLVANRTLPYEATIEQYFASMRAIYKNERYKLLMAESPLH